MDDQQVQTFLANGGMTAPTAFRVFGNDPVFPARFRIGECAAVAHGLAASAAADLHEMRTGDAQSVTVDVGPGAGTLLSGDYEMVDGEPMPPWVLPSTNALYQCADGDWIYLQGQLPHLHQGILGVLGCEDSREAVAGAVAKWNAFDLEEALAERRLCGARARTPQEWESHPHGSLMQDVPAVEITRIGDAEARPLPPGRRPLEGVRVLEVARILAGPMTGRTLAEHGAEVLNVGSRKVGDFFATTTITGHGKRSAYMEFDDPDDRARLDALLADCDVFVDGNRAGSLEAFGLGAEQLAERHPGIVVVSVNCYGHTGPWRERRGWEQLAQMVSGLAIGQGSPARPEISPPGAPNDFITGILAAYGAMTALARRAREGGSWHVKASLTQTAMWIVRNGTADPSRATGVGDLSDLIAEDEGPLGRVRYLGPAARMGRTPPRWDLPAPVRGGDQPVWLGS